MTDYNYEKDGDRRNNNAVLNAINDLKTETITRLTRLETQRENQVGRCNAHSRDIMFLDDRQTQVEQAIAFKKDDKNPICTRVDDVELSQSNLQTSYTFIYGAIALIGSGLLWVFYWAFGHVHASHEVARNVAHIIKHMRFGA